MLFDYHVSCQIGDEFAEKRRNRIFVCVCVRLCVYLCICLRVRAAEWGSGGGWGVLDLKYPSIMGI